MLSIETNSRVSTFGSSESVIPCSATWFTGASLTAR